MSPSHSSTVLSRVLKLATLLVGLSLVSLGSVARATEILVPSQYPDLVSAVAAAQPGDTVSLADGTYSGPGFMNVNMRDGVSVVSASGNPANCVIDLQLQGRAFYFGSGIQRSTVLSGITIINAYLNYVNGSAIYMYDASPTISNCVVTKAVGEYRSWGAVGADLGSPLFSHCVFSYCSAGYETPGIVWLRNTTGAVVDHCTFANNTILPYAYDEGMGALNVGGDTTVGTTINACEFINNSMSGFSNSVSGNCGIFRLSNSLFHDNYDFAISLIRIWDYHYDGNNVPFYVDNCTIVNNGGGIRLWGRANGDVYGGPGTERDNFFLTNSIIRDNSALGRPSLDLVAANVTVQNCNYDTYSYTEWLSWATLGSGFSTAPVVTLTNNINLDPMFKNPATGDYSLQSSSPCKDAGINSAVPAGITTDFADNPRISGSAVDIGCYEIPATLKVVGVQVKRAGVNAQVKFQVTNTSTTTALNAALTGAWLGAVAPNQNLPLSLGTLAPGASVSVTLVFKIAPGTGTLVLSGTSSLGAFTLNQNLIIP